MQEVNRRRPGREGRAARRRRQRATFQAQRYRTGGDVITKVAGKPVQRLDELAAAIVAASSRATRSRSRSAATATRAQIRVKLGERPLAQSAWRR